MCRLYTANYANCISENGISISDDEGITINYSGQYLSVFSSEEKLDLSNEKNIEKYYKQVLSKLDPKEVLEFIPEESILLDYENNIKRHLVAFWFELFLGITTAEVIENPIRETLKKTDRPEHLKQLLEDIIKENYEMNDFSNIKDAYLYNKSTQEEVNTKKLILT